MTDNDRTAQTDNQSNNQANNQANNLDKKSKLVNLGMLARDQLENLGSLIESFNIKRETPHKFHAADLSVDKGNLFRDQTISTSAQLVGNRFASYGKYIKKVVPDSTFEKAVDAIFSQIAHLAANWSQLDLNQEQRLNSQHLSDIDRHALARDIANQNRALATLGGLTGLAGLPGMLADTLWLLLVSLRTTYQLAAVYDQPLIGKEGINKAYAVIAASNLSKMQEKQAILAGLGVAGKMVDNAEQNGLHHELKNQAFAGGSVSYYAEQIDLLIEKMNLDLENLSMGWAKKIFPMTAVVAGCHYNSLLIEEVIGVAQATFAPEIKLASLTDKRNEQMADDLNDDDNDDVNSDDNVNDDNVNDDNVNDDNRGGDVSTS